MNFAKQFVSVCLVLVIIFSFAFADDRQVQSENLWIDTTDVAERGTFQAAIINGDVNVRYKLGILHNNTDQYYYDIEPDEIMTIPLAMGNGNYAVSLYANVTGIQYQQVGSVLLTVQIDEQLPFLNSNSKVNYEGLDQLQEIVDELCSSKDSDYKKWKAITKYIDTRYGYDYIKAMTGKVPKYADLQEIVKSHLGTCEELSALTVSLLRLSGVPAKLIIGKANKSPHAWVTALIGDSELFFDPSALYGQASTKMGKIQYEKQFQF